MYIIQVCFSFVNRKCELIIKNRQRILGGGTRNLCTGAQNLPQKSPKIYSNLLITPQNYDKIIKTMNIPAAAGASFLHFVFILRFCTLAQAISILHFTFALRCHCGTSKCVPTAFFCESMHQNGKNLPQS